MAPGVDVDTGWEPDPGASRDEVMASLGVYVGRRLSTQQRPRDRIVLLNALLDDYYEEVDNCAHEVTARALRYLLPRVRVSAAEAAALHCLAGIWMPDDQLDDALCSALQEMRLYGHGPVDGDVAKEYGWLLAETARTGAAWDIVNDTAVAAWGDSTLLSFPNFWGAVVELYAGSAAPSAVVHAQPRSDAANAGTNPLVASTSTSEGSTPVSARVPSLSSVEGVAVEAATGGVAIPLFQTFGKAALLVEVDAETRSSDGVVVRGVSGAQPLGADVDVHPSLVTGLQGSRGWAWSGQGPGAVSGDGITSGVPLALSVALRVQGGERGDQGQWPVGGATGPPLHGTGADVYLKPGRGPGTHPMVAPEPVCGSFVQPRVGVGWRASRHSDVVRLCRDGHERDARPRPRRS